MHDIVLDNQCFQPSRRYRVVQWAAGNVGSRSLRAVVEHPYMELVGLYVHSAGKAGKDAGELAGLKPLGIKATQCADEIIALKPDCVIYMQHGFDTDVVCRLLEAGINIVTTRHEVIHPASMPPQQRQQIEAACQRGQASIHATGSSPGFITQELPLVLASLQRNLTHLSIYEFAYMSQRNSPEMMFDQIGFGREPSDAGNAARADFQRTSFGPALMATANALGFEIDAIESVGESALTRQDITIAAGALKAGTVAAQRSTTRLCWRGVERMRMVTTWFCTYDLDQDWLLRGDGWHVKVDGDAPFELDLQFTASEESKAAITPGYTAHPAVNAVPMVCEAESGIRTAADLPRLVPCLQPQPKR